MQCNICLHDPCETPVFCDVSRQGELQREQERIIKPNGSRPFQQAGQGASLMAQKYDPIKYVVPGLIVEGLTILGGKPKIGKSWLLLHAAVAVAHGGWTLGEIHCVEGDVLYCALEDNERRLQSRLGKMLQARLCHDTFRYYTEMPRLGEGGLEWLEQWAKTVEHPRLVVLDTLAMIKSHLKAKDHTQYDADYASVQSLRELALRHHIAIVVVHHLRKADGEEPIDLISGTLGLAGCVDSALIIKRDASNFVLHGMGREIPTIEKALDFNKDTCVWRISGEASEVRFSHERKTILQCIRESMSPIGAREIAAETGLRGGNIRRMLGRMVKDGDVIKEGYGKYKASPQVTV